MNNEFVFLTDDSCDLPRDFLTEKNIGLMELSYNIDAVQYKPSDMPTKEFYNLLRAGKKSITSQVSMEAAKAFMQPYLQQGQDVFYLAFSSGLSGTCNSGMMAAQELRAEFPDRKIIVVDSLAASMGQGLMVYKLQEMKEAGATVEEMAAWAENNRDHVVHMVTVDDLMHLHRGGRISRGSAIVGSMLGIKPMIHLDDAGTLKVIDKVRGRKQALVDVVDKAIACVGNTPNDIFMVSHGDCEEDALFVAELITKRLGIKKKMINYVGSVIGSHTGPGVIALFLMAEHK